MGVEATYTAKRQLAYLSGLCMGLAFVAVIVSAPALVRLTGFGLMFASVCITVIAIRGRADTLGV